MSSFGKFEYSPIIDPRQQLLLEATKDQKKCMIYIDKVEGGTSRGLSENQLEIIKNVINKEIFLSKDRDHHMNVTILGESRFSITIDGESKFYITRHETVNVSQGSNVKVWNEVVIQDKIKDRSFISTVQNFFRAIANLFYTPSYPTPELKDRTAKEAVAQDYRALRKALENGRSWIRSKSSIRLTSKERKEDKKLNREIDGLINHAKDIEKALNSNHPSRELDKLADLYSRSIFVEMEKGDTFVIPIGYLTSDNVLQPVMLKFEKNSIDGLVLEIYADSAEGKGEISPLHRRIFNGSQNKDDIKDVLKAAFSPMIISTPRTSDIQKGAKPSSTFEEIAHEMIDPRVEKERMALQSDKTKKEDKKSTTTATSRFDSGEHLVSLTFEQFIRDVDAKMENFWRVGDTDQQERIAQPSSPSERVTGWFNHLIGSDNSKLSTNEKLNLMFFITEDFAQDQLRQVNAAGKSVSLEKKLEVYERVANQIEHMRNDIATSLNDGHPLDTEGVPQSLRETEAVCRKKSAKIRTTLLERKRAGADKQLQNKQSSLLGFKVDATIRPPPVAAAAVIQRPEAANEADEVALRETWEAELQGVKNRFTPHQIAENRSRQIVNEMTHFVSRRTARLKAETTHFEQLGIRAKSFSDMENEDQIQFVKTVEQSSLPLEKSVRATLAQAIQSNEKEGAVLENILDNEFLKAAMAKIPGAIDAYLEGLPDKIDALDKIELHELISEGTINQDKLEQIVQAVILSMDRRDLELIENDFKMPPDEFASIIKQLILNPHQFPVSKSIGTKVPPHQLYYRLINAMDPQKGSGAAYNSISADLAVLLNIRMLLPRDAVLNTLESGWNNQIDTQLEIFHDNVKEILESYKRKWNEKILKAEIRIQKLTKANSVLDDLSKDEGFQPDASLSGSRFLSNQVTERKIAVLASVADEIHKSKEEKLDDEIASLKDALSRARIGNNNDEVKVLDHVIKELEAGYFAREKAYLEENLPMADFEKRSLESLYGWIDEIEGKEGLQEKASELERKIAELSDLLQKARKPQEEGGDAESARLYVAMQSILSKELTPKSSENNLHNIRSIAQAHAFVSANREMPEVNQSLADDSSRVLQINLPNSPLQESYTPEISSLTKVNASEKLEQANYTLVKSITEMSRVLGDLSQAASIETDPLKKKALYEEIKTRSLELLSLLPPPGTDGSTGIPSIWRTFSSTQSQQMRSAVHQLQHHVWEAQMRLALPELSGRDKFMMIKAQAINMALIRADVEYQKGQLELVLTDLYQREPQAQVFDGVKGIIIADGRVQLDLKQLETSTKSKSLHQLRSLVSGYQKTSATLKQIQLLDDKKNVNEEHKQVIENTIRSILIQTKADTVEDEDNWYQWNTNTGELKIDWNESEAIDWNWIESTVENNTLLYSDLSDINPLLLTFDSCTLDTLLINQTLTQDLTTCLSQDASLDKEVQAVYHFIVADQNRGATDYGDSVGLLREQSPNSKNLEGRFPILYAGWKHKQEGIQNPRLLTMDPEALFTHLLDSPDYSGTLAKALEKRKKPTENEQNLLKKLMNESKSTVNYESPSGAIKWNHQNQTLNIDWDNSKLEWGTLQDLLINPEVELAQNLFKHQAPNDSATKVLNKLFEQLKPSESYKSPSGAIDWNDQTKALTIKWSDPALEWEVLLEMLGNTNPSVQECLEVAKAIRQTSQADLYYKTASDPGFTLYATTPIGASKPTRLTYFETQPVLLLSQTSPLDIYQDSGSSRDIQIRTGTSTVLADVHIYGKEGEADWRAHGFENPDSVSEQMLPDLKQPRRPFLPTSTLQTDQKIGLSAQSPIGDIRTIGTYDVWQQYVMEKISEEVLTIPGDVLLELFRIRQSPKKGGLDVDLKATPYVPSTVINAFDFMLNYNNSTYMQNDFVQKYIYESIFGPLVLQQALIDHPEHFMTTIEQLHEVIQRAQLSQNHELIGFYTLVLNNLSDHIHVARNQVREQGMLSPAFMNLPAFSVETAGAFGKVLKNGRNDLYSAFNENTINAANVDKATVMQPIASKWKALEECAMAIDDVRDKLKGSDRSVKEILLSSENEDRPIDMISDTKARKHAYVLLLNEYREQDIPSLKDEEILEILKGYQLLKEKDVQGNLPAMDIEIETWVKHTVLPHVRMMDRVRRDKLLIKIVNFKLKAEGQDEISEELDNSFIQVPKKVDQFQVTRSDNTKITLNLSTMEISGIDLTKRSRIRAPIPQSIMGRSDVMQALQTPEVRAIKTVKGEVSTYTWDHEGQTFELIARGPDVTIKRTLIDSRSGLPNGTYTFMPILLESGANHGEKILGDNGLWIHTDDPNTGWVFGTGMQQPFQESLYKAVIDSSRSIKEIQTLTGKVVSTSFPFDAASPILFANTESTMVLIGPRSNLPEELRIPKFGIAMTRAGKEWNITWGGKELGKLKETDADEKQMLSEQFGPHWDEFIVPILDTNGKTSYLMIPYAQQVDRNGKISVDQSSIQQIPNPMLLKIGTNGRLEGSQASDLYLAHRFLLQAEKTRNPAQARKLFYKAEEHIEKASKTPPPSTPEEVDNLKYAIQLLKERPAISLKTAPTRQGLTLTLKLELLVHHIREKAKAQNIKTLQLDPKNELDELSSLARLFQAYEVSRKAKTRESLETELFSLTTEERSTLTVVSQRMLLSISEMIISKTPESYFGSSGRLESKVTLEKPKEINPQFLLYLVRRAKPYDPQVTLKGVDSPLPLEDLLDNFWSYLLSIKNEDKGLTPEKLMFLFKESILPPCSSPQMERELKALDLQVRQFLLGMADIVKQAGGSVDILGEAQKRLEEAKENAIGDMSDNSFQDFIGQFKGVSEISENYGLIIKHCEGLVINVKPDSDPPSPDLKALKQDIATLKTYVENYKEALEGALKSAKKLITDVEAQNKKIRQGFDLAKKNLNDAHRALEVEMEDLETEYSEASIKTKIQALEKATKRKLETIDAQMAAFESEARSEIKAKEEEISSKLAEVLADVEDTDEQEAISKQYEEELSAFTKDRESLLDERKAELEKQVEEITQQHEADSAQIKERFSQERKKANEAAIEEKYKQVIGELEKDLQAAEEKLEEFLTSEIHDPLSGDKVDRRSVISGGYKESLELDKLPKTIAETANKLKELEKQLELIEEKAGMLKQWELLQTFIEDIEKYNIHPNEWFTLPESGAAREFINHAIKSIDRDPSLPPLPEPPSMIRAGFSLIKQMGLVDSVRLASGASEFDDLEREFKSINSELKKEVGEGENKISELDKAKLLARKEELKKKYLSNPLGNLITSASVLAPLLLAGEVSLKQQYECQPAGVLDQAPSLQNTPASRALNDVMSSATAEQCFTESQLETMRSNLEKISEEDQRSYVDQLRVALDMSASLITAQTGMQDNIAAIENTYGRRSAPLQQAVSGATHDFGKIERPSLSDRYQTFYTGNAGFPDRSKADAVFLMLGEHAKNAQAKPTVEYLKDTITGLTALVSSSNEVEFKRLVKLVRQDFAPLPKAFEPYLEAIQFIAMANQQKFLDDPNVMPILSNYLEKIAAGVTRGELLLLIQDTYDQLAPFVADSDHREFVQALQDQTLPEDSLYTDGLAKGFDKVREHNPLAFTNVIGEDQLKQVKKALDEDVKELSTLVSQEEREIVQRLEAFKLKDLPKPLQKIRLRQGTKEELLQAAYAEYRNGAFDTSRFKAEALGEGQNSLDELIGQCLIDKTRLQVLKGARFNASSSLDKLVKLIEAKRELRARVEDAPAHKIALEKQKIQLEREILALANWMPNLDEITDNQRDRTILTILNKSGYIEYKPNEVEKLGVLYKTGDRYQVRIKTDGGYLLMLSEVADIESLQTTIDKIRNAKTQELARKFTAKQQEIDSYDSLLQDQTDALDSMWRRESDRIRDYTGRCQSSEHITKLPDVLKPYGRQINYLQERLGLVLRDDQIETLKEIVENPSLLKQLRMGLGKTSIILPFALMILGAKGHNTIGMVPKALFTTNFDEMDETTRVVFELSGNRFLFSRQDATFPLNALSLQELSNKCAGFFRALERGEYILTTIESKASLDNKINEIERSQSLLQNRIDQAREENDPDKDKVIDTLFEDLSQHQMALDMLYKVKAIFEADRTRLIIDEVDSVAKANYSVNSESGSKTPIAPKILKVSIEIFDIIRNDEELKDIFSKILENNQFTLNETQINETIKQIGKILIKDLPITADKEAALLDWLAGLKPCPYDRSELQELGNTVDKLKVIRKALNSSLRSCLSLKSGLSCDYDPTHGAIGVPATQGVTTKTTKYSDPLMQVMLTQMIALYKPQSEDYLKKASLEVIVEMHKDLESVETDLEKLDGESALKDTLKAKQSELSKGIFKLSSLINPLGLLTELQGKLDGIKDAADESDERNQIEAQIEEVRAIIAERGEDSPPIFQQELGGNSPLNIFLRQRFAQQVAKRGMIYVSTAEMSRPVQNALRGCHIIGLTGTARSETVASLIEFRENDKALKGVREAGKESTAEVVYRFVKAMSKKGDSPEKSLQRKVSTYSLDSQKAFQQFVEIASPGSGYRFIVNQAGACDHFSLREITMELHKQSGKRPIVYLDMDEEGRTEKVAIIDGKLRPLNKLTEDEQREVELNGFFYYHTPHVRGTHFDIPPGSKGALMLSPKVNADDRDQAIYRARALGEGHIVEPFISEKQSEEFSTANGQKEMTLGDLLKVQHHQTKEDEDDENLAAYTLHIKGLVNFAADQAKQELQLQGPKRFLGDWMRKSKREEYLAEIEAKVRAFAILEDMFVKDTGNDAYLRRLESEMRQGGTMETGKYLKDIVIAGERARIARFLKELDKVETDEKPKLENAIAIIKDQLTEADKKLQVEAERIDRDWETLHRQFPEETSSAPATQETAETEAEAEAEAQAETTSETETQASRGGRSKVTKGILTEPDHEMLAKLSPNAQIASRSDRLVNETIIPKEGKMKHKQFPQGWREGISISPRLDHMLGDAGLGQPPQVKVIVINREQEEMIYLTDSTDANELTGHRGFFTYVVEGPDKENKYVSTSGYSVIPWRNPDGKIELKYGDTGTNGISEREKFDEPSKAPNRGNIYVSLLLIGLTPIADKGWSDIEQFWKTLDEGDQDRLKGEMEKKLTGTMLKNAASHLWDKPPEVAVSLGGSKKPEVEKYTDYHLAVAAIEDAVNQSWVNNKYRVARQWVDTNAGDAIKKQLMEYIDNF